MKLRITGMGWLALLMLIPAGTGAAEALMKFRGKTYTKKDLPVRYQQQIFDAESGFNQSRKRILEDAVIGIYFAEKAKKAGKTADEVRDQELAIGQPTDKELRQFYDENKQKIPYPFDQIKRELVRIVKEQNRNRKRQALLKKIGSGGKLTFLAKAPVAPRLNLAVKGFASRGNRSAKVTVVEFADYFCPHCRHASETFKKLYKKYDRKVHFVFIDYPLKPASAKIAEGAFCAGQQKKYWEYHTTAFEQQGKLKTADAIAEKAGGLDMKAFKSCVSAGKGKAIVDKGKAEGTRIGVTGTPAIYVNGRKVNGVSEEILGKAIDDALAGKGAS